MREVSHDYYLYVIEARDCSGRVFFYVGQSALGPEARLRQHQKGKRYCPSCTTRHYLRACDITRSRLRPEFYAHYNPMDKRPEAEKMERWVAQQLRKRGYRVVGGH